MLKPTCAKDRIILALDVETLEEVEKITNTEYNGDYESALSDLLDAYNELKQKIFYFYQKQTSKILIFNIKYLLFLKLQ